MLFLHIVPLPKPIVNLSYQFHSMHTSAQFIACDSCGAAYDSLSSVILCLVVAWSGVPMFIRNIFSNYVFCLPNRVYCISLNLMLTVLNGLVKVTFTNFTLMAVFRRKNTDVIIIAVLDAIQCHRYKNLISVSNLIAIVSVVVIIFTSLTFSLCYCIIKYNLNERYTDV